MSNVQTSNSFASSDNSFNQSITSQDTQSRKHKLALLFAGATLAASVVTGLPAYAQSNSTWDCYFSNSSFAKRVSISWGHTPSDATWACNAWIPECANNGGCFARRTQVHNPERSPVRINPKYSPY